MAHALSGRGLEIIKKFLAEDASEYDVDNPTGTDPYSKILGWAEDPEHGGLPSYSARPFAVWLSNVWVNFTEEPGTTVKDVLEGAMADWCGGRVMPS